jgi:hypothetical protein
MAVRICPNRKIVKAKAIENQEFAIQSSGVEQVVMPDTRVGLVIDAYPDL